MNVTVVLWVLVPLALFLALVLSFATVAYRTRGVQFRSQMPTPTPATGRRAPLVNVAVPADRTQPAGRGT